MARRFLRNTALGALIGGIAGLLLAPKSGRSTRRELKQKGQSLKRQATDQLVKLEKAKLSWLERWGARGRVPPGTRRGNKG